MKSRVNALDGLRGIAALWVLVGHAAILTGFRIPILSEPDLGVDLFIMLSGYLMVFQFDLRSEREPWERPSTWIKFWIRRFFRIAPLYYVALFAALALGAFVYDARMALDLARDAALQSPERYLDASPQNVAMHMSFLFGLFPKYAFRTALPDWSIGLEMQFYAVFPFLMLLLRRTGPLVGAAIIIVASTFVVLLLAAAHIRFPMPAFLPLKMPIFLCGMLIASLAGMKDRSRVAMVLLVILICTILPFGDGKLEKIAVRPVIAIMFASLIHLHRLPRFGQAMMAAPEALLSSRPMFLLGELSFGAYLIHLLLMQPIGALLLDAGMDHWRGAVRCSALAIATIVPTYAMAFIAYRSVELPGQRWGRHIIQGLISRRNLEANA